MLASRAFPYNLTWGDGFSLTARNVSDVAGNVMGLDSQGGTVGGDSVQPRVTSFDVQTVANAGNDFFIVDFSEEVDEKTAVDYANYTLFHPDGRPARATVSLQLQEWPDKPEATNPTSMGSGGLRTHRVVAGETLDLIAYDELGAASRWPYIAELNNLDDPLSITPGQYLVVAPLK